MILTPVQTYIIEEKKSGVALDLETFSQALVLGGIDLEWLMKNRKEREKHTSATLQTPSNLSASSIQVGASLLQWPLHYRSIALDEPMASGGTGAGLGHILEVVVIEDNDALSG